MLSVICRQQFALNNIFFDTTRPRALIFGMKHYLVGFYQVCSNGGPEVQKGPEAEGGGVSCI